MIQVLVATNRQGSRSEIFAESVYRRFKKLNIDSEILRLSDIAWDELNHNTYGADAVPASIKKMMTKVNSSDGLYVVCPEYNGSYPGVVKTFIDYWDYPASFEKRPICFTGMGGMFGGLRPVEHLQQVFGYRNAFMFPERIFLQNVWEVMDQEGNIKNELTDGLIEQQLKGFDTFIKALKSSGLHCNS